MINVPASRIKDLSCASFPEQDSWENKTGNSHDLRLLTTPLGYKALYFPTCQVTFTFLFNLGPGHFCSWLIAVRDGPSFFWGSGREEGNFLGHDFFSHLQHCIGCTWVFLMGISLCVICFYIRNRTWRVESTCSIFHGSPCTTFVSDVFAEHSGILFLRLSNNPLPGPLPPLKSKSVP